MKHKAGHQTTKSHPNSDLLLFIKRPEITARWDLVLPNQALPQDLE
jgi:hypothetical protein